MRAFRDPAGRAQVLAGLCRLLRRKPNGYDPTDAHNRQDAGELYPLQKDN
jgi:hypothetical protein